MEYKTKPIQGHLRPFHHKFFKFLNKRRGESESLTVAYLIDEFMKNNPDLVKKYEAS